MRVYPFKRPALDEEIRKAQEQIKEAEASLRFLTDEYLGIRRIFDAVRTGISPAAAEMLIEELDTLEHEKGLAAEALEHWRDILDVLLKRNG